MAKSYRRKEGNAKGCVWFFRSHPSLIQQTSGVHYEGCVVHCIACKDEVWNGGPMQSCAVVMWSSVTRASIHSADGCILAKYLISWIRDFMRSSGNTSVRLVDRGPGYNGPHCNGTRLHQALGFYSRYEIWQAPWQQGFPDACQIWERYDSSNNQSHGFNSSRNFVIRHILLSEQRPWYCT